ncbi:MAG: glycosyltransferase [Elusimicrobia bacterium]|nr:glycosyltransferase [Elusimicrobiota bacterium]
MRIALVHDWLTGMRGGEKVLEVLCELYPQADLYTLVHLPNKMSGTINKMNIHTSALQHWPNIEKYYRYYLPIMPFMIERFNLQDYDCIVSTSHCVAKGIRYEEPVQHICYCFTPMRYIWDMYEDYFSNASWWVRAGMRFIRGYLRQWDVESSERVHHFVAISQTVQERIQRIYKKGTDIIYPPVDVHAYNYIPEDRVSDYYLCVGAFAAYKRIDLIIEAFNKNKKKLIIIGDGQEQTRLKKRAMDNITFLGWVDDSKLRSYYARARALIFPGLEDFGIVPVEAMACGTPVIAFNKGGASETVINEKTGILFNEQNVDALSKGIETFEKLRFNRETVREEAIKYARERFKKEINHYIETHI